MRGTYTSNVLEGECGSSVSVVVSRLIKRGFVTRRASEEDGRRAEVALSPKGRTLLRRAPPMAQAHLIAGLGRMQASERGDLARGLAALACYILLGGVVGLASVFSTRAVYAIEDAFEKLPIHWMWWPALGGLVVGVVGYFSPRTLGGWWAWPPSSRGPRARCCFDDCSLHSAADHMVQEGVGRLPVVSRDAPARVVGIVTRSDLLAAHRRRLDDALRQEQGVGGARKPPCPPVPHPA